MRVPITLAPVYVWSGLVLFALDWCDLLRL